MFKKLLSVQCANSCQRLSFPTWCATSSDPDVEALVQVGVRGRVCWTWEDCGHLLARHALVQFDSSGEMWWGGVHACVEL